MMTTESAHHIYTYSRIICNNGSLKISSIFLNDTMYSDDLADDSDDDSKMIRGVI